MFLDKIPPWDSRSDSGETPFETEALRSNQRGCQLDLQLFECPFYQDIFLWTES